MPEVKGKILEVSATQQVTERYSKRELVLEYVENPQYPEYIKFETGKPELLENLRPGQEVEVFFNLKGRKWTDKMGKVVYFNTLQVWKVSVLGGASIAPSVAATLGAAEDDDLPF